MHMADFKSKHVPLTSNRWTQQASEATDEHEEPQCAAQPLHPHHLSEHSDVDGHRRPINQTKGSTEDGQFHKRRGQRTQKDDCTKKKGRDDQLVHLNKRDT